MDRNVLLVDDQRDIFEDAWSVSEKIESLIDELGRRSRMKFSELFQSATSRTEIVPGAGAWPVTLLVQIADDHDSILPQVRNVQLAIRFARHSALDWDNPALPDDVEAIADLLNMGITPTMQLLHRLNS